MSRPEPRLLEAPEGNWRGAIASAHLSPTTKLVALTLALHMCETGTSVFPTSTQLARQTSLSPRSVKRHVASLKSERWLTRSPAGTWRPTIPEPGAEQVHSPDIDELDEGPGRVAGPVTRPEHPGREMVGPFLPAWRRRGPAAPPVPCPGCVAEGRDPVRRLLTCPDHGPLDLPSRSAS